MTIGVNWLITLGVGGQSLLPWVLRTHMSPFCIPYRGADKPLARPGRKQARKHVKDACDFNTIETRAIIKLFFLQGKAPKEIHAILTETLAYFLPGRAKDLSAPLYNARFSYFQLYTTQTIVLKIFFFFILPSSTQEPPPPKKYS